MTPGCLEWFVRELKESYLAVPRQQKETERSMRGKEGSLGPKKTKTISRGASQDFRTLVGQESSPRLKDSTRKEDMKSPRQRQTLTSLKPLPSSGVPALASWLNHRLSKGPGKAFPRNNKPVFLELTLGWG